MPLSPKPSPSAAPAAMATTFFVRAAQLDAEDVLVDVETETPPGDPLDHALGEREVRGRDDGRRRQVASHLGREVRSRQRGDPAGLDSGRLGDDEAHAQQRALLEPLDHGQQVRPGREERRHGPDHGAEVRGRGREDDEVGGVEERPRDRPWRRRSPAGPRPEVASRSVRSPRSVPPSPGSGTAA